MSTRLYPASCPTNHAHPQRTHHSSIPPESHPRTRCGRWLTSHPTAIHQTIVAPRPPTSRRTNFSLRASRCRCGSSRRTCLGPLRQRSTLMIPSPATPSATGSTALCSAGCYGLQISSPLAMTRSSLTRRTDGGGPIEARDGAAAGAQGRGADGRDDTRGEYCESVPVGQRR